MAGRFEGPVGMQEPHPDDDIVVYHTTTPERAAHLKQFGTAQPKPVGRLEDNPMYQHHQEMHERAIAAGKPHLSPLVTGEQGYPGRGLDAGLYVTRHPSEGFMYGTHSLPVRIKAGDLGVSSEMQGHSSWSAINQREGYIPHVLQPHQFGDVYTAADHRDWDNQHG